MEFLLLDYKRSITNIAKLQIDIDFYNLHDYNLYLVQFTSVKFGKAKDLVFLDEIMVLKERFSRLPSCIERASFHSLGKACINWNHLNFIFCDKRYFFSFKNSQQQSFPSLSKSCPTKLILFLEKLEKMTHLLSIEIERLLLVEKKVVKIDIYSIYKLFLDSVLEKIFKGKSFKSKFGWNLRFLPKCISIRYKGITFEEWKVSSYNLLIQESCKLAIFENIFALFNPTLFS